MAVDLGGKTAREISLLMSIPFSFVVVELCPRLTLALPGLIFGSDNLFCTLTAVDMIFENAIESSLVLIKGLSFLINGSLIDISLLFFLIVLLPGGILLTPSSTKPDLSCNRSFSSKNFTRSSK